MRNFKTNYDKVFGIVKALITGVIDPNDNFIEANRKPKVLSPVIADATTREREILKVWLSMELS